jgi:flagellar hook-associated protein 2
MDIGSINFSGLASGLDTKSIVEAILRAERQPAVRLESKQTLYQSQKSALDQMRSKLTAFSDALRGLSADVTFRARTAKVSDDAFLRATPGAGAETGIFSIEVLELASAHKVRSNGVAASDQGLVSDGTITIQAGGESAITVDVSAAAGNNSLEAVRDAINNANRGVEASVLFDGTYYRLVVRSEETGVSHALSITDTTNLGLAESGSVVTAAADASLVVDGVAVTSSSNQVTGVVSGTTLNLLSRTTGTPVTVEVRPDLDSAIKAVQSISTAYNEAIDFFNAQFDRDNPGVLASDGTARMIQQEIQSLVTGGIAGIPLGGIRSLSAVGISFDGLTGKMSLDSGSLRLLLEDRFDDVGRLFLASGVSTDPRIRYQSSSSTTVSGDYAVEITRAAEQAAATGSTAISGGGLGRDETLAIGVGSATASVALTAGMTIASVVDATNAALRAAGVSATAMSDGGRLRIATRDFGSAATISVTSSLEDPGDGTGSGFGTTAATGTGVDVAGRIGGADATGEGQYLTGAEGGAYFGLTLRVTASAADVAATGGDFGTLSYSRGLVRTLLGKLDETTGLGTGPITSARDALEEDLKRLSEQIERIDARLVKRRAYLTRSFAAAESAIAALQAQQSQLGSILGS